ncbi:MAG: biotin--[acetyl-CoA-carboxylase] ligase [Armatimonadetes bacterium]|nr:biotin--[acetyl-CoA-carboxylase] ligase [Armatimonadota bacterium]PIU66555.1 MAG: biotin--[acetyl-CoA-carboxylase] ligase [Armatimonadetes bacterium CG07_land_8_20_14_0_80_59_28]PIX42222.1 MAG: biotin--[acetyl-CoA-carboxylase] ligase [Armatimonadetes bacterium CG_4_8_14_3_um_filter_58_9]PJB64834.1 MAG: biotin--[acetyl-CoA-carboxylase] ligase [Armatimonadetes bacterium CG_4_9_14_3_um_filter_58_7]
MGGRLLGGDACQCLDRNCPGDLLASTTQVISFTDNSEWNHQALKSLTESLATRAVGRDIHFLDVDDSTNDVARQLARAGADDGTVVIAERQSSGRGRMNRSWHSPRGGIWASVLFMPNAWTREPALLVLLSPAAIARATEMATGLEITIKWPNDLRTRGRKVAGILGEVEHIAGGQALILGFGVNANIPRADFPLALQGIATSLMAELGRPIDMVGLLRQVLIQLDTFYIDFNCGNLQPWLEDYRLRCDTFGNTVTVNTPSGEISGIAEDIDAGGALLLRDANGNLKRIVVGDIR